MGKVAAGLLVATVLPVCALTFLFHHRSADRPRLFAGSTIHDDDGGPLEGWDFTLLEFDESAQAWDLRARARCFESCPIEWLELRVIRREDWTGDDETSTWTTVARATGGSRDGHWEAETAVVRVPRSVAGIRVEYQCRGGEPWGGWSVLGDRRDWIERTRDWLRDLLHGGTGP